MKVTDRTHSNVKHSIVNIVSNIVTTLYVARWVLDLLRGTICKVCDCLITMLYTWNQCKIILSKNCNWKMKFKLKNKIIKSSTRHCSSIRRRNKWQVYWKRIYIIFIICQFYDHLLRKLQMINKGTFLTRQMDTRLFYKSQHLAYISTITT